jgi:phospholipid/cholesterol/gamma-HCH transport system ATP-binding protein
MSENPVSPTESPDPNARRSPAIEIRVEGLCKSFGDKRALDAINLEVHSGEMVAIVGSSGSGKSTLLRHLTGHFKPDRGRVLIADHESTNSPLVDLATLNPAGMERLERHWAVVFQQNGLITGTVYDDIALPLRIVQGLDESTIRTRVSRVIRAVGLDAESDENINVDQLSGGMAKRVAIAGALALDPVLIFYDEPTTGLDPSLSWKIQDVIQMVHQRPTEFGLARTSLVITHDKDLLHRLRPRIVMLEAGRIVFEGNYEAFEHSDSPFIQPYLELMPSLHRQAHQSS